MILLSTSTGSLTPLTVLCAPLPTTTSSDELVLHSSLVLTVGEQVGTGKAWGELQSITSQRKKIVMKNLIQAACFLALVCSWADTANAQRYKTPYKTQTGYNSGSYGWEGSNDPFHSDLGSTSMDVVIHDKEELKMAFAQQALLQKQGDKTFYQSLYVSARTRGESHTHHTTDHHHYGTVDYKHSGTVSHHHSGTVNYSKPIGTYRLSCGAKRQVYPAPGGGYRFYNKRWYYSRSWSYWNYSYFYRF